MSVKDDYTVEPIYKKEAYPWIKNKHYSGSIPSITHSFGLFDKGEEMVGVCTFGNPLGRELNNGDCVFEDGFSMNMFELNRLISEDGLPRNAMSYFVGDCLDRLPTPSCVVSYADGDQGHHGYVYQATNWIYTGKGQKNDYWYDTENDEQLLDRTVGERFGTTKQDEVPDRLERRTFDVGKFRYFYFLGDKRQKREMREKFEYEIKDEYPKGDNEEYDVSHETAADKFLEKVKNGN